MFKFNLKEVGLMLNSFFNISLSSITSFKELNDLIQEADAYISIFGGRFVTIPGKVGSLYINEIVDKVTNLVERNFEFSEKDRDIGRLIVSKIDFFYQKTDQHQNKRNIITRMLSIVRECLDYIKNDWEICENEIFEFYTRSQFESVFGRPPTKWRKNPDRWKKNNSPSIIFIYKSIC
jgi:hypothetical protein